MIRDVPVDTVPRHLSLVRFAIATAVTLAMSFGVTILLVEVVGASKELAYGVALLAVYLTSFAFLRWWIYGRRTGPIVRQFLLYSASALSFRGAEYGAFWVLHTWLGMYYLLAMLLIQGTSFVAKFVYYEATVFRRQHVTTKPEV